MLDPALLRERPETVSRKLRDRGVDAPLDAFSQLDASRRALIVESEDLKHRKNLASQEIGRLMKEKRTADAEARKEEVRGLTTRIDELEPQQREIEAQIEALLCVLPNLPHDSVPVGADESGN